MKTWAVRYKNIPEAKNPGEIYSNPFGQLAIFTEEQLAKNFRQGHLGDSDSPHAMLPAKLEVVEIKLQECTCPDKVWVNDGSDANESYCTVHTEKR